jgi:hypothetical protein
VQSCFHRVYLKTLLDVTVSRQPLSDDLKIVLCVSGSTLDRVADNSKTTVVASVVLVLEEVGNILFHLEARESVKTHAEVPLEDDHVVAKTLSEHFPVLLDEVPYFELGL